MGVRSDSLRSRRTCGGEGMAGPCTAPALTSSSRTGCRRRGEGRSDLTLAGVGASGGAAKLKLGPIRPQGVVRPFLKSAIAVLEEAGESLDAEEIVRRAIEGGLLDSDAADADSAMMRSVLTNSMRQKGEISRPSVQDGRFRMRAGGGAAA